jgi:sec-independent protein translocase protein TatA
VPNIGPLEIVIVLVLVLIIFGPKRLPELGRSLGRGMREFKQSITGDGGDDRAELDGGSKASGVEKHDSAGNDAPSDS